MTITQKQIKLINNNNIRPNEILVNNEVYSMSEYLKHHNYNWQATANGNILYYRSKDGKEISVKQLYLYNLKER